MRPDQLAFSDFTALLASLGVTRLYMKRLAPNDNSKNQVYLGHDFSAIQIIPSEAVVPDDERRTFKAALDFYWLADDAIAYPAPGAQLILYPDYPEVRFSGFLHGATNAPSELMASRLPGRILLLGIRDNDSIIGYATTEGTPLVNEILGLPHLDQTGVFLELPLVSAVPPRTQLLRELKRIHQLSWIDSKRLTSAGLQPCQGQNCGGLTLEAELGIVSNSKSEPDYLGYEVKQYRVRDFNKPASGGAITLMTPEPQGGIYKEPGVEEFVRRYGYPDAAIQDRLNFSGIHHTNVRHPTTGLMLVIQGYDITRLKITDVHGAIELVDAAGTVAALWKFQDVIAHWSRKHNHAVYVPSQSRKLPQLQYAYGHTVLLAEKTSPLLLLHALATGRAYYDPGIHLDHVSTRPQSKRRSQFRIPSRDIGILYDDLAPIDLLGM